MKIKRALPILLIIATLLVACTKNEEESAPSPSPDSSSPEQVSLENYYASEKLNIDIEASGYKYDYANGRIYYSKTTEIRNTESRGELTGRLVEIFSCDKDGNNEQLCWSRELPATGEGELGSYQSLLCFGADEQDNLWILIEQTEYNDKSETNTFELVKSGANGSGLTVALSEIESIRGALPSGMLFDRDGNVYIETGIASGRALFVYSGSTGEYLFDTRSDEKFRSAATTNDGRVVYLRIGEDGYELVILSATGVISVSPDPIGGLSGDIYNGAGDYNIFYYDDNTVYGISLETMNSTPVISLINSDIAAKDIYGLECMSDTQFLMAKYVSNNNDETGVYRLTYNADAVVTDKVILTLGLVGYYPDLGEAIQKFNAMSKTSRIEVTEYDYTNSDRLDLDILNGNAPDILLLSRGSGLSMNKYMSKGVLSDLTDYLENDEKVSCDDLFENILELGSKGGKLYHVIPRFTIRALVGKTSIFGDESEGMSLSKMKDAAMRYPDAELISQYSRETMLYALTSGLIDDFVDWETATCDFKSEQFIELLETLMLLPESGGSLLGLSWDEYEAEYNTIYKEDRTLLYEAALFTVREMRSYNELFGEEVSVFSYPSSKKTGHSIIADVDLAIMESSKHKDEAWEFISMFLQADIKISSDIILFSINKRVFEADTEAEMIPLLERDFSQGVPIRVPQGTLIITSPEDINIDEYANYHITADEAARMLAIVESVTKVEGTITQINAIIFEEAELFFAGARSAEETAQVIQSRVSIYVSENA